MAGRGKRDGGHRDLLSVLVTSALAARTLHLSRTGLPSRCPSPRPWMPQQRGRRRAANVKDARPGQQQDTPGWTQDTERRGIREDRTQQGTDRSTRRVTSAHCCSSAAAQQRLGRQPVLLTPQGGGPHSPPTAVEGTDETRARRTLRGSQEAQLSSRSQRRKV
jgi:hypothetical protein